MTAVFVRQCGNGGAAMKSGNHASQKGGGGGKAAAGGASLSAASDSDFAKASIDAAKSVVEESGRTNLEKGTLGGNVLISEAFKKTDGTVTLESFKTRLSDLNQRRVINLGRADMGYAFPNQSMVQNSLIKNGSSEFHFIRPD